MTFLGHAGYDDYGKDIVCASISALVINFINSAEALTSDQLQVEADETEGRIVMDFPSEGLSKECQLLYQSLMIGLSGIEKNYPKYFHLNIREVL